MVRLLAIAALVARLLAIAALVAGAGCEASLSNGGGGGGTADANGGGNVDSSSQQQIDAAPACPTGRKVFLEFLGVTLTDAATSDAPANTAQWLTTTNAVIPQWRQGSATRATEIQEVIDGVKQRLSTTPIEVVTARPTSGTYVMVVLGGANVNNGGTVGTIYSYATSFHDCDDTVKNDVAWISDMNPAATGLAADAPTSLVADLVVGAIGWSLGLDGTTDTGDCMCGWANGCTSAAGACTLAGSIAVSITNPAETACHQQNQNETAAFTTNFCQ